jgi:hypothetical protein
VSIPDDTDGWDAAQEELQEAAAALLDAQRRGDRNEAEHQRRHDAAQAAVDAQEMIVFTVRALPPKQWEALVDEHPAKDGATHGWDFDPDTFWGPMLEQAVTLDGEPWTVVEQDEMLANGNLNVGERNTLINTAVRLNTRTVGANVGKGSAQTSS